MLGCFAIAAGLSKGELMERYGSRTLFGVATGTSAVVFISTSMGWLQEKRSAKAAPCCGLAKAEDAGFYGTSSSSSSSSSGESITALGRSPVRLTVITGPVLGCLGVRLGA